MNDRSAYDYEDDYEGEDDNDIPFNKPTCPAEHNEYWVVDAEPNDIIPPFPTGNALRCTGVVE